MSPLPIRFHYYNRSEEGVSLAATAAAFAGFDLPEEDWTGHPDRTASVTAGDTTLVHQPVEVQPFLAVIACRRHGAHQVRLSWPFELRSAQQRVRECSAGEQRGDAFLARAFLRISARMRPAGSIPAGRPRAANPAKRLRVLNPAPGATTRALAAAPHPAGANGANPANIPLPLPHRKESA